MGLCITVGWEAGWGGGSSTICDAQVLLLFMNPRTRKKERKSEREKESKRQKEKKKKKKKRKEVGGGLERGVLPLPSLQYGVYKQLAN